MDSDHDMMRRTGISKTDLIIALVVIVAVAVGGVVVVKMQKAGQGGSRLTGQVDYDSTDRGRIDSDRILYRRTAQFDTKLKTARAIAIGPTGKLYVAGDSVIRIYDNPNSPGSHRDLTPPWPPECLTVAPDGSIYVADRQQVAVYNPDLTPKATWRVPGEDVFVSAIAVMDEDLYLADSGGGVVLRCDRSGKILGRIGRKDKERNIRGISGLNKHLDLAAAPDGLLRVGNSGRLCVEAYTPQGDLEVSFGQWGRTLADFCGCCNPVRLAVAAGGEIVTTEKSYRRVKIYSSTGEFLGAVASPEAFPDRGGNIPFGQGAGPTPILDVAVDAAGVVWVLDTNTAIVRGFSRKDTP